MLDAFSLKIGVPVNPKILYFLKYFIIYQKGCVSSNKSTRILQQQIEGDSKIIVTTIQKLSTFIKKNKFHNIYNKKLKPFTLLPSML